MNKQPLNIAELEQLESLLNRLHSLEAKAHFQIKAEIARQRHSALQQVEGRTHINPQTFDIK